MMKNKKNYLFPIVLILLLGSIKLMGQPTGWEFFTTKDNHSIVISTTDPFNAEVKIAGMKVERGDYIGAFYKRDDAYVCGGFTQWSSRVEGACQIAAWGDDPETQIKDGFVKGEALTIFVFRNPDLMCKDVTVKIKKFGPFTNDMTWEKNGNTTIVNLEATCSRSPGE